MSEPIRDTLTVLADEMPAVRLPDDPWRRGRRRRRLRRIAAATGVVAALAALAGFPAWGPGVPGGSWYAEPGDSVPDRVYIPWLWQATVEQSPPGRAAVTFQTDQTIYLESTGVVVGRGGAYRIQPLAIGEDPGPLSPDGRYYVVGFPQRLLDLQTGKEKRLPEGTVLAWSRDGRQVLMVRYRDDPVIEYGPDGKQLNDPSKPDDVSVVEVATGSVHRLGTEDVDGEGRAAFAPDARRVVVTVGESPDPQALKMMDAGTGKVDWSVSLGRNRMLAGPGAWSRDGRIALFAFTGCDAPSCDEAARRARRWRIEFVDADTGADIPGSAMPLAGEPGRMLGWRYGADPVVVVHEQSGVDEWRTKLVAVRPDGGREVLLDPPSSVTDIDVPGDLVEDGRFAGTPSRPDPFAARWEVYPVPAVLLAAVALFALRQRARLRGRAGRLR